MLEFDNVSKSFPCGTLALKSVKLSIPQGQFCVVLGPSGAGKSTLLRMVNGLTPHSKGKIWVNKLPVTKKNIRYIRRNVAMIHQHYNLTPRMSAAANVLSGALPNVSTLSAMLSMFPSEMRRKCCKLLYRVGLSEEHLHRRVSDLSGGQQQRVGVARALMLDPAVILADEPVASLDPKISLDIMSLIHDVAREHNATVLCSLHQVDLARKFADRIIGMHNGEVVFDGKPSMLSDDVLHSIYHGAEMELIETPCAVGPLPIEVAA
jgi:phosphonate transport system ATP-binding protein